MKNGICQRRTAAVACFSALLPLVWGTRVLAGPLPMPLEAHLDLAEHVVVGELTQLQETGEPRRGGIGWGRATVDVRETLKGPAAKTLSFRAATWSDPNAASPPRVYRKGDSGIWLVMPDGIVAHYYGRLEESRKHEVERILKLLASRQWSAEVSGLKAWACVVQPDYHGNPVIVFAVKNVSDANIHYPADASAVVSVRAESSDKTVFRYPASPRVPDKKVFCRVIAPGETVYLHPDYSFIDLAWKRGLTAGTYTVTVTYQNDRDGEAFVGPTERIAVPAWKGQLKAPAVKLVLPAGKAKKAEARPKAPAGTDEARH